MKALLTIFIIILPFIFNACTSDDSMHDNTPTLKNKIVNKQYNSLLQHLDEEYNPLLIMDNIKQSNNKYKQTKLYKHHIFKNIIETELRCGIIWVS